ncbi:MAG: deoxyribonuclease V [Planctomycetes bacterium]|nr:deoxyribonuclease V [Planctomycetota bacterium]
MARSGALPRVELVAGVDCSERADRVRAAIVVVRLEDLEVVATATAERVLKFPYVPGLLAFREVPAIEDAWRKLEVRPDVLLVDGHGIAHPRRIGVASHVGVVLDVPSIGCGKSVLVGAHEELALTRGSRAPLFHDHECVGVALRTRDGVKPIYVSVGHRIDLERAIELVLACAPRFRVPEPIRRADRLAGEWPTSTRTPVRRSRSTGSAGRS